MLITLTVELGDFRGGQTTAEMLQHMIGVFYGLADERGKVVFCRWSRCPVGMDGSRGVE